MEREADDWDAAVDLLVCKRSTCCSLAIITLSRLMLSEYHHFGILSKACLVNLLKAGYSSLYFSTLINHAAPYGFKPLLRLLGATLGPFCGNSGSFTRGQHHAIQRPLQENMPASGPVGGQKAGLQTQSGT